MLVLVLVGTGCSSSSLLGATGRCLAAAVPPRGALDVEVVYEADGYDADEDGAEQEAQHDGHVRQPARLVQVKVQVPHTVGQPVDDAQGPAQRRVGRPVHGQRRRGLVPGRGEVAERLDGARAVVLPGGAALQQEDGREGDDVEALPGGRAGRKRAGGGSRSGGGGGGRGRAGAKGCRGREKVRGERSASKQRRQVILVVAAANRRGRGAKGRRT